MSGELPSKIIVGQLAKLLGNEIIRIKGNHSLGITRIASLGDAGPGSLSFCKSVEKIPKHSKAVLIVPDCEAKSDAVLICVENPRLAFIRVASHFLRQQAKAGIDVTAIVDPTALIWPSAHIGAHVVVEANSEVGPDSVLHPGVVIYPNSTIGARVTLHANVVVGVDGFGFERDKAGTLHKFPHIGGVVIEDDVEIFANCTVARGALGDTVIKRGTKIDCLSHVAHNCQVGAHSILTAQSVLAGSVVSGSGVWFAPGCRVLNNTKVGNGATIGMGAIVMSDVAEGQTVMGLAARPTMSKKGH